MREVGRFYRTDACGRQHGPYVTIVLNKDEWDEKAKTLKVEAPYVQSYYELGCGWSHTKYEMAMVDYNTKYLLEGHEKPLSDSCTETMNEYNS